MTSDTPRGPYAVASLWGGAGVLAGAAAGVGACLPFYPEHDEGWAQLGWILLTAVVASLLALLAGAVAVHRGLRRAGHDRAGRTALVFVPVALLLGAATAGVGALAAPAGARWLVEGFRRPTGWAPGRSGLAQRLVLAVLGVGLATTWTLRRTGYALGGELHGELLVWAACLPVLVAVPVLLLRRQVRLPLLVAGIAVAAALVGAAVPDAVADAHPSAERLADTVAALPVPAGQRVVEQRTGVVQDSGWALPMTVLSTGGPVPPLRPGLTGDATAARAWEDVLEQEGWVRDAPGDAYWLARDTGALLAPYARFTQGPWVRATVVPYGDGALVVVSTRP